MAGLPIIFMTPTFSATGATPAAAAVAAAAVAVFHDVGVRFVLFFCVP